MMERYQELIRGAASHVLLGTDELPADLLIYPGSFNPLHVGHMHLLRSAEQLCGRHGLLELSIKNVDKPELGLDEIERRLEFIFEPVILTRAPTFIEKAELFPGSWFAMGYDTAIRLIDPRYHPDVPAMLQKFQSLETRFVVAGRLHNGLFQSLENIQIPTGFEELFISVPEELFRMDISSTELRKEVRLAEPTLQCEEDRSCSVGSMSREGTPRKFKGTPPRLDRVFQQYDSPLYFITFNTMHRRKLLHRREIHQAFVAYGERNVPDGRAIGRYVIMPDHIHLFVRIGEESKLSDFIRLLKQALTKELRSLKIDDEIWQPGFFDRLLRHSDSYFEKWNYVYNNPVRAGLVDHASEWPWQGEIVRIDRV